MANQEKEILLTLCKYCEMVNAHLTEVGHRLAILEVAMRSNPDTKKAIDSAFREAKSPYIQGLPRQLSALQAAVEKLRD